MLKLSKTLFWDIDYDKLNVDEQSGFVIERVLERGSFYEWKSIKKYYGIDKIKEVVINARHLNKKVMNFCSIILNIPFNQFKCYTQQQLNPPQWPL